jgi:hypothetical protein
MSVRTGIRISGFPVEVTETDDTLTIESEGTRDLILTSGSGSSLRVPTARAERPLAMLVSSSSGVVQPTPQLSGMRAAMSLCWAPHQQRAKARAT